MVSANEIALFYEKFEKSIEKSNEDFLNKLEKYILSKTDKGKLNDLKFFVDLEAIIRTLLKESGYTSNIEDIFIKGLEIKDGLYDLYKKKNIPKSFFTDSSKAKFIEDLANGNLRGSGLNENVVKKIANNIRQTGFLGLDIKSVTNIVGNIQEILPKYVRQVSFDTLGQVHGALQNEIKEKYKPTKGRYIGGEIETTRQFCKHLVDLGNPITVDELKVVLNEYCPNGKPKKGKGDGMIEGTTIDNFEINRGGYMCRHLWIWDFGD